METDRSSSSSSSSGSRLGRRFAVVNTHFDHVGQLARLHSARQLRQLLYNTNFLDEGTGGGQGEHGGGDGSSYPAFLVGDFNSIKRGSEVYAALTSAGSCHMLTTELICHLKPCMTDIYLHIVARMAD